MKVVFAGSSIYGASIDLTGIDLRPPAANGDFLRATLEGATVIGLIDGTFGALASVWHKEILYALEQGVTVLGGASMGALRAAECAAFGMIPVGRIAEAYIDGEVDDDSWVALTHGPPELDSMPVSEPLVDFEASLDNLARLGFVTADEARQAVTGARAMSFSERTIDIVADNCFTPERAAQVVAKYEICRVSQKGLDAAEVIARVRALPDHRVALKRNWQFTETSIWRDLLKQISSETEARLP